MVEQSNSCPVFQADHKVLLVIHSVASPGQPFIGPVARDLVLNFGDVYKFDKIIELKGF